MQIASAAAAANPDYLQSIFSCMRRHTLWRQPQPASASTEAPSRHRPDRQQLARLLQLLPRSFHPAIVQACCSSAGHGAACLTVPCMPCMPACAATCAASPGKPATKPQPADGATLPRRSPCAAGSASLTFQLLAAAAPLAGGTAERAWHPNCWDATHELEHRSMQAAGAARSPAEPPATPLATELPRLADSLRQGALISQLDIEVKGGTHPEPPRWCHALAQLRSLRALSVSTGDPSHLSPRGCGAALQSLPALRHLTIKCTGREFNTASLAAADILLEAVATLTQLSGLHLVDCIFFGTGEPERTAQATHLAKLPQLTSLTIGGLVAGPDRQEELVHTVSRMTELRELHVAMRTCDSARMFTRECPEACAALVLQTGKATLPLPALQALGLPGLYIDRGGFLPISKFHRVLCTQNARLLDRLTALNLTDSFDGGTESHMSGVIALLADTPALEALHLGYNGLGDRGLERLAMEAPCVSRLRRLVLEQNGATHVGLCAVLRAAARGVEVGGHRLRELDVSGNLISAKHAAEFAALLQRLPRLEVLNVRHLFDSLAGLRGVVPTLEALLRLRCLRVYKGWDYRHKRCGDEASVAPLLTGLHRVHID